MVTSIVLVALGIGLGWMIYGRAPRRYATDKDPLEQRSPAVFAALSARLGFDELYAATVFRLNHAIACLADFGDRWIWGGVIKALAGLGRWVGMTHLEIDEEVINRGFDGGSETLRDSGQSYAKAQTGDAHGYLLTIAVSFVVLAVLLLMGGGR
jgi:NADH-quinone oxidoreductase subunit L